MRKHLRWAALLALIVAAPLAAQQDPAALVVRLQGQVQVRHGGSTAPAAVGARLVTGDEVLPASGARAILITRTGAQQVVTEATTIEEPRGGGNPDLFARAMSTLAQAASADARTAGGRQGMIRPIPGEPVLVAPRNGLTVTADRPAFSWMPVEGAASYTLQLRKLDGGHPMRFEVAGTEWTLPADQPVLETGATYAWTVAPKGGRPTREQQFRVIGTEDNELLGTTLGEVRAMGLDPMGDGIFLTAVIFRDLGLYYDADVALRDLEKAGDMSADLYLLKGEILNVLGHEEEARKAFDKADAMMR
ncbi:MAG: hypothetical protein ACYC6F_01815 [Longimicrobiales bacterium]